MMSSVRFRSSDDYFKVNDIIFRRPAPGSPDMEGFRQRFFEMTGEPYDMYEARMAAAAAEAARKKGSFQKMMDWLFGWLGPSTPIMLKKDKNGPKDTDNHA